MFKKKIVSVIQPQNQKCPSRKVVPHQMNDLDNFIAQINI